MAAEKHTPSERRIEMVATVLLGVAAVATAWSSYQAALWSGIQSSNYSQASALRTEAAQKHTEANQYLLADLSLIENYLDADFAGDSELAAFYRQRFRPEAAPAFEAWLALDPRNNPDAPATPFEMPEYRLSPLEESDRLNGEADAKFEEGEDANNYSDTYVATTLFFASVLFFAAISERFEVVSVRLTLLAFAAIGLVGGFIILLTQPVTFGG